MNPKTPYRLIEQLDQLPWLRMFLVGSLYILSSWPNRIDANVQGSISLPWPPAGIAVAATLIFGLRVWPAVAMGAFLVAASTGAPLGFAVVAAMGSAAETVIVAKVLGRSYSIEKNLSRTRDVLLFIGIAVVVAPIAGVTLDALGLCLFSMASWSDFVGLWRLNYIGDAMGILVVAPAVLTWSQRPEGRMTRRRGLEAISMIVLLATASQIVYGGLIDERIARLLSLACFPFIVWGALRFGQRGTTTAAMVAVFIAVPNTVHGLGPFVYLSTSLSLAYLYGLMGAVTVIGLLLGAVVTEYRSVAMELSEAREMLEERVADRTAALEEQLRERERVSMALRESEERYRRITQTITDYIYVVSFIDGHAVRTTHAPTCAAVTGYSSEEFVDNPFLWFHMVYPDDRERVLGLTTAIMSSRKSVSIEHRIIRKDGVVRWIRNTTVPILNAEGVLMSYDGLIQDITDRKLAEKAVSESESQFRAVFDSAGIGIAISSLDGLLQRCNPALERMLGYGPGELDGQPSKRISHPDEHLRLKDDTRRIMLGTGPENGLTVERRFIRKDGSTLWGRLTTTMLRDAAGNPQSGIGIVEDITVQKATEQEREKLLRQVREAMANVRTLSGLVPICSSCKKIRDDRGEWEPVEEYVTAHTGAEFTHGICPDCLRAFYPEYVNGYADLLAPTARRHATGGHKDQGSTEG
jgi:PAS domain S-box-containing protein